MLEADTSEAPKDYFERIEQVPRLDERDVRYSLSYDRKKNGFIDMFPIELHVTMTDACLPPTWSQFLHRQN